MSRRSEQKGGLGKAAAAHSSAPALSADERPGGGGFPALKSKSHPAGLKDHWTVFGICVFLAAIIWTVFGQTLRYGFVNLDDDAYVSENPEVARGLTFQGIAWAFTHVHASNWHPLTWISHMLDCQFYGLNAGGHHLTNVLLHLATTILLFFVLRRMTGFLWRSAFVAAVFAVHPLRAESVAWVAERKDVLSGLFFMLTLLAYASYVSRLGGRGSEGQTLHAPRRVEAARLAEVGRRRKRRAPRSTLPYVVTLAFFALGLMCKPMLVTLPFVLLLLDYWPLGRLRAKDTAEPVFRLARWRVPRRPVFEKLPLLALAAASGAVTVFAQAGAMLPFGQTALSTRLGNGLISYAAYLGQMFWPAGLAVLYPFPGGGVAVSKVALSLALLAGISSVAWVLVRRRPYLWTGWLWYLIMLTPVIGILQVGSQARADRYTYLPQIGLYFALTWTAADLCAGLRNRRLILGGGSVILLAALMFCARRQISYWRDSESLWTRALACTSGNFIADDNLGTVLSQQGRADEAIVYYRRSLQTKPDYAEAHSNLGNALLQMRNVDEAIGHFEEALRLRPGYAKAHNNLGIALIQKGRVDEAIAHYEKAVQIKPDYARAHNNLGNALLQKGQPDEAILHYRKALQILPGYPEFQSNLAWVLATASQPSLRNGNQAVELAEQANRLAGGENPTILRSLAAAYAEAGRFSEAVATAQRALHLAEMRSNTALANAIQSQMTFYQAGRPFRI
jgi:tetratricopeptide (TPR) repeat protein